MRAKTKALKRPIRLGFVALSDCAPIVMANELGLFAKYGIDVKLQREVGWATIRDKIVYGELEATHAPAGLVVAASCGLGSIRRECLTGLVISLNGNAITLSQALWQEGVRNGATLRERIVRSDSLLTLAVVHPFSAHSILLRNWLNQHRIVAERDVQIVVVPPAQVYANLKAGHLDGYCVGEPWNSLAVLTRKGWCASTSEEIAPSHPEKVLMVQREFAETSESEHHALIAAILEACQFCQRPENRERLLETLAEPKYVGAPIQALRMGMAGTFDYGNGRVEKHSSFHIFAGPGVNIPTPEKAEWVVRNLVGAGIVKDPTVIPDHGGPEWFRADIFARAAQLLTEPI